MSESMTSENSSINAMRHLGAVPKSSSSSAESKWQEQAANIPESVKSLRNVVNLLGKDDEVDRSKEDAFANRLYYRAGESLSTELISAAENPYELFSGLRSFEKMLEDGNIPQNLGDRYTPSRHLTLMYERAEVLGMPIEDLVHKGLVVNYDATTGRGEPKKRKYASLALNIEEGVWVENPTTGKKEYTNIYDFGTPVRRKEMGKAYNVAVSELETRDIMGEHIGLRTNIEVRDSLETMVAYMHGGRMPKFKPDHLQTLFNLPGLSELQTSPENRVLGDQVEEAMFLNLVMLKSGSKTEMENLLARPGAKFLIAKMAKEKEVDYDTWVKTNIGNVDGWTNDSARILGETWREEKDGGLRGEVTKWSNICAWEGKTGEFSAEKEKEFIEETIGGLIGSVEASWLGTTMMRVTGAFASEGYTALPNGNSLLPLGEGRYISGDDTGKFWGYMFNMKEGLKGRTSGLEGMIGKVPDMAMNLFDWAQIEMDDLPLNPDGTKQKRSVWDAWLGTENQQKRSLLTGELSNTGNLVIDYAKEEPYHRLGEINFNSLEREFHGTFTIMQWLMGNEKGPTGVFIDAMETSYRYEDFQLNALKKKKKYIGIVMNPIVLTKGSTHLYTDALTAPAIIQRNYLRNLMIARIHSYSFAEGILNSKVKLFNPEAGGDAEVPASVLVKAFVEEVLKDNPKDEQELHNYYIDENKRLRKMGKSGTPGIREDVSALLDAKFEYTPSKFKSDGTPFTDSEYVQEVAKAKIQMKYVGKVTGKKR